MTRNFKGIWVPKEIYLDERLNWTEKILLIEIYSLDNEKGCFASNPYFADFIGVSETSISLAIKKLKKLELVYQESFDGRTRILKAAINPAYSQTLTKLKGSVKPNLKDSNTDSNTTNNFYETDLLKIDSLQDQHTWLEAIALHYYLKPDDLKLYITEFIGEQKLKDNNAGSMPELKSHFVNWIKYQLAKTKGVKKSEWLQGQDKIDLEVLKVSYPTTVAKMRKHPKAMDIWIKTRDIELVKKELTSS